MSRLTLACAVLATLASLPACKDDDDTGTPEGDTDADTDTDTDTDTDADTDVPMDLIGIAGEAIAGPGGYDGVEEQFRTTEEGKGEDVCRVRYELHRKGDARTDCKECLWAWDTEFANAQIVAESGIGCEEAFGITPDSLAQMNGKVLGMGYIPDYYGHAAVLTRDVGKGWEVATFASWDEKTGTFTYRWDQGLVE